MNRTLVCDFCGQPGDPIRKDQRNLELDEDGLWVCRECKERLVSKPVGDSDDDAGMDEEIKALVGKSAGAICRTLELSYEPPYQSIIDAASKIAYDEDRYMSTWSFVAQWQDGTTVWQSEDRSARAFVFANGTVQIESRT